MLRETRKRQTKEAIIRHAVALFKLKGYEHVTVEDITAACGIAKGTFFNYFPKKEDVLLQLTETYMPLMDEMCGRNPGAGTLERLLLLFDDLLALYAKHYGILRYALLESVKGSFSAEGSNIALFVDRIAALLQEAKEAGRYAGRWDPQLAASVVAGQFIDTLIGHSRSEGFDAEQVKRVLSLRLRAVWEGLDHA